MLMPGMLTDEEMAALDQARGPEFDRLFLTGMIRHHQGAIDMVDVLFKSYGAAQDETVFKFASDVYADQSIEIDRMHKMLENRGSHENPGHRRPSIADLIAAMTLGSPACGEFARRCWRVAAPRAEPRRRQRRRRRGAAAASPRRRRQQPAPPAAAGAARSAGRACRRCGRAAAAAPAAGRGGRGTPPPPPPPPPAVMPKPVTPIVSATAPTPDPRVGLKAGPLGRRRRRRGTCAWSRRRRRPGRSLGATHSDLAFTRQVRDPGQLQRLRDLRHLEPVEAGAGADVSLPRVAERRLGLQEPAVHVVGGDQQPRRLRLRRRARAGQQDARARHPHVRHRATSSIRSS